MLLLLRHAEAEATRPGFRDPDRRLTERGRAQAAAAGHTIRAQGWAVDRVLCSPAGRARETLASLRLPDDTEIEFVDSLYDGGSDRIIELIQTLLENAHCALVVGHAPGVPGVLHELIDPATADPVAWSVVGSRFPPATLAALAVSDWADLDDARLVRAVLAD